MDKKEPKDLSLLMALSEDEIALMVQCLMFPMSKNNPQMQITVKDTLDRLVNDVDNQDANIEILIHNVLSCQQLLDTIVYHITRVCDHRITDAAKVASDNYILQGLPKNLH